MRTVRELLSRPISQSIILMWVDLAIIWGSTALAYFLRFQGSVPNTFLQNMVPAALASTGVFIALFYFFRLYHQVLRYVGVEVVLRAAAACAIGFTILVGLDLVVTPVGTPRFVPIGTLFILTTFTFIGVVGVRSYGRLSIYIQSQAQTTGARRVLIVGAGDAGSLLIQDINSNPGLGMRVAGVVDDDSRLHGRSIRGARVLGTVDQLAEVAEASKSDEVLVAVPSANPADRRRILDACSAAGLPARMVRMPTESRGTGVADLQRVSIEDLLGREPVDLDFSDVRVLIEGRIVAVTGAAGSIGSELCRQLAALRPSRLLLLEIDETRLYEIFLELSELGLTEPVMHICDIRDDRKLTDIFLLEKPDIVLHAAAYKHVPLMEISPDEAIKTNVGGTRNVLRASEAAGVMRFVLISTDKAVAPTTVMGLSKSIAERLTLEACRRGLNASAVRFGNVLGSRGSVVPLFEEQMRRGGHLKVTHPDVTRYFMTIPEAARLVVSTVALGSGGEVFVLDMGEPVKIVDLAKKMMILSGVTAPIEFTGLRPAEKLHEVLAADSESLVPTSVAKISQVSAVPMPSPGFDDMTASLGMFARLNDRDGMKAYLAALAPEFVGHGENMLDRRAATHQSALATDDERLF